MWLDLLFVEFLERPEYKSVSSGLTQPHSVKAPTAHLHCAPAQVSQPFMTGALRDVHATKEGVHYAQASSVKAPGRRGLLPVVHPVVKRRISKPFPVGVKSK
jgi:hypothetical protein